MLIQKKRHGAGEKGMTLEERKVAWHSAIVKVDRGNTINAYSFVKMLQAAPVAQRLRALFLNHSIISPLCLVWV